jgi:3D (Asp-Asp-Asp) domain-containing protein
MNHADRNDCASYFFNAFKVCFQSGKLSKGLLRFGLVAVLLASAASAGQAGTFVVFGPVTYVRDNGSPTPVTASFAVVSPATTYTMQIENAGVSSAVVTLNGVEVASPSDFNQNVTLITKQVALQPNNQLSVELRGQPGGHFTLLIVGDDDAPPTIVSAVTPAPNGAGWNKTNPTVTFTCADLISGVDSCSAPVTITTETSGEIVLGTAIDKAGNAATKAVEVKLDKTPPTFNVTSHANGAKTFASQVAIGGNVVDALSGLATFTCNGAPGIINGASFSCGVTLAPGANSINIAAADVAGNTASSSLSLIYTKVPAIAISSPGNLSYLNISPTTVTGTVDDPAATVVVNSVPAAVVNGAFSVALPLAEGPNTITASATSTAGAVGTASLEVTLDTTPPHVTITSPPDQFVTTDSSISVAGNVNDIVVGTVNSQQAQVNVNGAAADVANRTFLAASVPLAMGTNIIQAVGRDRVGNAATTQITVIRQAPTQAQIRLISGNNQTGAIGSLLQSPLVVAVTDSTGNPVPNKPVIFKVTQNDGMVSAGGQPAPTVVATTDGQGRAQAQWKLGLRSGAGSDSVEAYAIGFDGTALFTATGAQGAAGKIVIDTGNNQIGAINQPLPKPLIAVVVDNGNNRLAGIPVTFTVKQGGGSFDGQPSFTVNTDSDGRAAATLMLGSQEGAANNLVEVNFPSNQGFPASFTASGRAPGEPSNTTISGVVLDNSNTPIPGVTIRAVLTNLLNSNSNIVQTVAAVQTDAQGQFAIPQAPVGFVKLLVDGSTALRPGKYPSLDYDMVTVAGQSNTLGMPIYLLALNPANELCVTATTGGGTLTMPEAPGFSLTFGPGQVTFPGGSKTGCVSVTVVHGDKVPMVPGFGQQPRFIVTIQPAGALFNQPAAITLPNVDGLRPRAVTEMYSFDHDIGSFVAIGTGTVSDDGLIIRSNPGVGVLKAGWHCGGDPAANGTAADCGDCKICQNNNCVADNAKNDTPCTQTGGHCGTCKNGTCDPIKIVVTRSSLTQTSSTGTPQPGGNPAFTYAANRVSGASIATYTTNNPNANPNIGEIRAPANPSPNGAPSPGGLAEMTVTYKCQAGDTAEKKFRVATFGLSCYVLADEGDHRDQSGNCTSIRIGGVTYSGVTTNPTGLPAGNYCTAFLADVRLQGSGTSSNGTMVHYVSGANPTWTFQTVTQFTGADGTALIPFGSVARDRSIVPRNTTVQLEGRSVVANDTGGAIIGYRLDVFGGTGRNACANVPNTISVGACNPGTAACPALQIP